MAGRRGWTDEARAAALAARRAKSKARKAGKSRARNLRYKREIQEDTPLARKPSGRRALVRTKNKNAQWAIGGTKWMRREGGGTSRQVGATGSGLAGARFKGRHGRSGMTKKQFTNKTGTWWKGPKTKSALVPKKSRTSRGTRRKK